MRSFTRPTKHVSRTVATLCVTVSLTACASTVTVEPTATTASASTPTLAPTSVPVVAPTTAPQPTGAPSAVGTLAPTPSATPSLTATTSSSRVAPTGHRTRAGNPLANRPWGVYKGPQDMAWEPYVNATGTKKTLLGKIALAPKAKWFGDWIPLNDITRKVNDYVEVSQSGNPRALVQMTVFRMVPWEHDACERLPTPKEQAAYKAWTDRFAAAVGNAHTAIVLQPDGPFALCAPGGSKLPSRLIAYSAKKFSALPNTSVYIEVGSWDWPHPGQGGVDAVLKFLIPAGVEYTRGFALNGTHYSATSLEVQRGADIARALSARGIKGKKFVVNTSSNGHPFEFGTYTGPDADNAFVCKTADEPKNKTCVALGIPPTTNVAAAKWGLDETTRRLAAQYADAYLWFGRPWLYRQNQPFITKRALMLASASRW